MNSLIPYLIAVLALLFGHSAFAQITVTTNKQNNLFEIGEYMEFKIETQQYGSAYYSIKYDNFTTVPIQTGEITLIPGVVITLPFTLQEAGFVHIDVNLNGQNGSAGVAFAPFGIKPLEDEPEDFLAFWMDQKSQFDNIPMDVQMWLKHESSYSKTYHISMANIDNRRTYGYITIPNGEGPFPAILTLPPATNSPNTIQPEEWYSQDCNAISMTISIHNAPLDQSAWDAYDFSGINNKETVYFKSGILGALRAIDYIFSREDFDQTHLAVSGTSQGGGLSIIAAGLDQRVNLLMVGVPALCEHSGLKYNRASGWPAFLMQSNFNVGTEEFFNETQQATKYYDAVHAAKYYHGPAFFNISYLDLVVPPATSFAAYNNLKSNHKTVINAINSGHSNSSIYWLERFNQIRLFWPEATMDPPNPYAQTTTGYYADAGQDTTIAGNNLAIDGQVFINDSIPWSWPVRWRKLNGPGEVLFDNGYQRQTNVSFSENGVYQLEFKAEDNMTNIEEKLFVNVSDIITVTVGDVDTAMLNQTINFPAIEDKLVDSPAFQINPTASSGLPVAFAIASGPAYLVDNVVHLNGTPGFVTIKAEQVGNEDYNPAPIVEQSFEVKEIEDNGGDCDEIKNIAIEKNAYQSGTQVGADASRAVDGNTDGNFWSTFSVTNTEWLNNAWWEVDLGSTYQIEEIKVWNRTDCCAEMLKNFYVIISEEPFETTDLGPSLEQAGVHDFFHEGVASTPSAFEVEDDLSGRYIRIQLLEAGFITLAEVEIMGCSKNEASLKNSPLGASLFPNPVSDVLNIKLDQELANEEVLYAIYNIQGICLKKGVLNKNAIDVAPLESGLHFLKLTSKNGQITESFVKTQSSSEFIKN